MDLKQFMDIFTLCKNMKPYYVLIMNNIYLGFDETITAMTSIIPNDIVEYNEPMRYRHNELVAFLKPISSPLEELEFNNNSIVDKENKSYYDLNNNDRLGYQLVDYNNRINNIISRNEVLYSNDNLRDDPKMEDIIAMKKADGCNKYCVGDRFIMYLTGNILPVNKTDGLSLKIYNIDNTCFLSHFIITKKKFSINKYIAFRYLT